MALSGVRGAGDPPASVVAYIEDMLTELANMARAAGEPTLAPPIEAAAKAASQIKSERDRKPVAQRS